MLFDGPRYTMNSMLVSAFNDGMFEGKALNVSTPLGTSINVEHRWKN